MWFTAACPSWLTGCDKGTRWDTQPAGENPGAAPTRRRGRRGRRGPLRCGRGTIQNKPENAARVRQLRERWRLERPVGGAARRGSDRGLAPEAERATPGGGAGARRWKDRVRDARTATPVGLEREGCSDALPRRRDPGHVRLREISQSQGDKCRTIPPR